MFKDVLGFVLYCFQCFCDKYGVSGARFGEKFGSSRNDPKSIGICPESLISHCGIIKTPKILWDTSKKTNKKQQKR